MLFDNKVVVENYDQGVKEDTTYMIMSSTKSFTATMVGIAVADGKIESLDDPGREVCDAIQRNGLRRNAY